MQGSGTANALPPCQDLATWAAMQLSNQHISETSFEAQYNPRFVRIRGRALPAVQSACVCRARG